MGGGAEADGKKKRSEKVSDRGARGRLGHLEAEAQLRRERCRKRVSLPLAVKVDVGPELGGLCLVHDSKRGWGELLKASFRIVSRKKKGAKNFARS